MKINPYWGFGKTKPIKANNQSSLITNHLESKANSNPIVEGAKMNALAWINSFTIAFCGFLAVFTTIKGANFEGLLTVLTIIYVTAILHFLKKLYVKNIKIGKRMR